MEKDAKRAATATAAAVQCCNAHASNKSHLRAPLNFVVHLSNRLGEMGCREPIKRTFPGWRELASIARGGVPQVFLWCSVEAGFELLRVSLKLLKYQLKKNF